MLELAMVSRPLQLATWRSSPLAGGGSLVGGALALALAGERRRPERRRRDVAREADLALGVDLVVADARRPGLAVDLAAPREADALVALGDALGQEDKVGEDVEHANVLAHVAQAHKRLLVVEVLVTDVLREEGERFARRGSARVGDLRCTPDGQSALSTGRSLGPGPCVSAGVCSFLCIKLSN